MKKRKSLLFMLSCLGMLPLCGCSSTGESSPAAATAASGAAPAPEIVPDQIGVLADARMNFQGISRLYTYYVPSTYKPGDKLPLMITLHGRAFNAKQQLADSKFHELAEREGFIVIAPNCVTIDNDGNAVSEGLTFRDLPGVSPLNIRWNVGYPLHNSHEINDVAYISTLIDCFAERFGIDTSRVYLSGMSNGGLMSMKLATELGNKIAGVGSVGGAIWYQHMKNGISTPMKIVMIHGDQDPTSPINGVENFSPSIWEAADWFNEQFGVTDKAVVTELPQTVEGDETQVVKYEWPEKNGSQVVIYEVKGGGHTWPCGTQYFPEERIGKLSKHYSASELIWNELKNFHK